MSPPVFPACETPDWDETAREQQLVTRQRVMCAQPGTIFAMQDRNSYTCDNWRNVFIHISTNSPGFIELFDAQGQIIDETIAGCPGGMQELSQFLNEFVDTSEEYYRSPVIRRLPRDRSSAPATPTHKKNCELDNFNTGLGSQACENSNGGDNDNVGGDGNREGGGGECGGSSQVCEVGCTDKRVILCSDNVGAGDTDEGEDDGGVRCQGDDGGEHNENGSCSRRSDSDADEGGGDCCTPSCCDSNGDAMGDNASGTCAAGGCSQTVGKDSAGGGSSDAGGGNEPVELSGVGHGGGHGGGHGDSPGDICHLHNFEFPVGTRVVWDGLHGGMVAEVHNVEVVIGLDNCQWITLHKSSAAEHLVKRDLLEPGFVNGKEVGSQQVVALTYDRPGTVLGMLMGHTDELVFGDQVCEPYSRT